MTMSARQVVRVFWLSMSAVAMLPVGVRAADPGDQTKAEISQALRKKLPV
jgi:hypothetical protein